MFEITFLFRENCEQKHDSQKQLMLEKIQEESRFHTPEMWRIICHVGVVYAFLHWKGIVVAVFTNVHETPCFMVDQRFFPCDSLSAPVFKLKRLFQCSQRADAFEELDVRAENVIMASMLHGFRTNVNQIKPALLQEHAMVRAWPVSKAACVIDWVSESAVNSALKRVPVHSLHDVSKILKRKVVDFRIFRKGEDQHF